MEDDKVNQNFLKALKTMEEFKAKVKATALNIPDFLIPPDQIAAFTALPLATKDTPKNPHKNTSKGTKSGGMLAHHSWAQTLLKNGNSEKR